MERITVVKIGGNVIDSPEATARFVEAFAALEGPKMLIHGGGKLATRLAAQLGIESRMVDGRRITDRETLDVVTMVLDRPPYDNTIVPEDIPLDIVYEDDELMVINKPAGMVVHPGHGNYHGTLVHAVAWHLRHMPGYDPNDPSLGLVHRIDKDTSGLLVIAKTANAKTKLGVQFFNKTTRRRYNALVWGRFDEPEGRIEGNIARNPKDRLQMAVFPPDSGVGKPAVTHYRVLESFGPVTWVECVLETGRTHQIRAHMRHIGHPLFNDARYGGDQILRGNVSAAYRQFVQHCFEACPRQALHARTLGFQHPLTGQEMDFTSELPADMQSLTTRWRQFAQTHA